MASASSSVDFKPLYLGWIKEWWDEAKTRGTKDMYAYRSAYTTLNLAEQPFCHPDDLKTLRGFGPRICNRLKEKLAEHCASQGLTMPEKPGRRGPAGQSGQAAEAEAAEVPVTATATTTTTTTTTAAAATATAVPPVQREERSGNATVRSAGGSSRAGMVIDLTLDGEDAVMEDAASTPAESAATRIASTGSGMARRASLSGDPLTSRSAASGSRDGSHSGSHNNSDLRRAASGRSGLSRSASLGNASTATSGSRGAKPRKPKEYVPALRQGAYAIVLALSSIDADVRPWMSKDEIIELAQPHCDASFTVRKAGSFYTAWNTVRTLLEHDLIVSKGGVSKRYTLTEKGWHMARRFRTVLGIEGGAAGPAIEAATEAAVETTAETVSGTVSETVSGSTEPQAGASARPHPVRDLVRIGEDDEDLPSVTPIELPAETYAVKLVMDNRERVSGQRAYFADNLEKHLGPEQRPDVRPLSLGDAIWVAKFDSPQRLAADGSEGDELVLDWMVERKRQDDLLSSLRDGRFKEQRFRQRRYGVRNILYIIEDGGIHAQALAHHKKSLTSAMAALQMVDGCFVKCTRSVDETIAFLAAFTRKLQARYAERPLRMLPTSALTVQNHLPWVAKLREMDRQRSSRDGGDGGDGGNDTESKEVEYCVSYAAFSSLTSKSDTLTLRDVFFKMLMCTRGVTGERAIEIQKKWPTPRAFVEAFESYAAADEQSRGRRKTMVSEALGKVPSSHQRVTKGLSEKLAQAWAHV